MGVVMGPIQTGLGLMPSPVAGMGEAQELPWTGRWGPGSREISFRSAEDLQRSAGMGGGRRFGGQGTLGSPGAPSSPARFQDSPRSLSPRLSQLPLSPCLAEPPDFQQPHLP